MIQLDGDSLSLKTLSQIVDQKMPVELSPAAIARIRKSREIVDKAVKSGERIYSINTGFGILSHVTIPPDKLEELQVNLIRSHCTGVGELHTERESRAILLLRTNVLAKGYSGVRLELVEFLISMLNKKVHPLIPSKGSVGASGDLAPLAHLASVILGEGEAYLDGKRLSGAEALKKANLLPLRLAPKEGLSLINGTQQMTGLGALLLVEAERLCELADLICTASLEGVLGTSRAFHSFIQKTRPYPGQIASAERMWSYMEESEIYQSHISCDRVQDPYSFRCAPQVHGAARDLVSFVRKTIEVEINASTDNPLVDPNTGNIYSNGNFHGQPVAFAMDILAMALCEIGSLSERRIAKLIDPNFSGLPAFLVKEEGLNSGFMIAHVTAAALVSENRLLSHPGSTDSIPTSNEKEDHVSMGPLCARKAKTILENVQTILAIESLAACQALEFRKPLKPGKGPQILLELVRKRVPRLDRDRYLHKDIELILDWIRSDKYVSEVRSNRPFAEQTL